MKIKIVAEKGSIVPKYATALSAGMDLHARIDMINEKFMFDAFMMFTGPINSDESDPSNWSLAINPGGRVLIPTGLKIALEPGYEAQIRPRSGLALKEGLTVLNTPGTIN